jgi:hypothetical protein
MELRIRKIVIVVEEIRYEGLKKVSPPNRKAAAIAVIRNPFAGKYVEDLSLLLKEYGGKLGTLLGGKLFEASGFSTEEIQSFGKAAIVGLNGEIEHGSAILHETGEPSFGFNFRAAIGGGRAPIRSVEKKGGSGTRIDVPLSYKNNERVRSHFDSMEIGLSDAPMADEILIVGAVTNSGRPHPRIGGLSVQEVEKQNNPSAIKKRKSMRRV